VLTEVSEDISLGFSSVSVLPMSEVTRILSAIEQGDPRAAEQLLPLVYDELRQLAAHKLAQEKPGQTLQATALVHEAYIRLVEVGEAQHWNSRGHFFAAAAEAMRRILVESARRKRGPKHGGGYQRVNLEEAVSYAHESVDELLSLNEALNKLAQEDPKKAELVKLRYFTGLSVQEAADILGISRATADRYWAYAKVWLYCAISGEGKPETS
jgi:RNA polymerase sigma factor (TIGR02999 family)